VVDNTAREPERGSTFSTLAIEPHMTLFRSAILLASTASLVALSACNASKDAKPADAAAKGPAAATVNGVAIAQSTVDMIAKQGAGAGRPDSPESRKAIIDQPALQMVIAAEAVKKGLDKTPEVADQLEVMKQSVLANAYVQDFIKTNQVSDEMVKAEYDRLKATVAGTEYKAHHILVEKESEAKDIIAKLKKDPASFEKLAMEKSKDPGSKVKGGDLGWVDISRMVPEFGAALSKLEKGKSSTEPVKTQFGYHVIRQDDARPVEAPPMEAVKPQITQQLQQQNWKKQVEALKAAAKIEVAGASASAPAAPASK
jgi:peptidyl-prolyl cis-trans isomerase C